MTDLFVLSKPSAVRVHSAIVKSSTQEAQNGKTKPTNVFYVWYSELCRRQNTSPISQIRPTNLKNDQVLDVLADRIKIEDWGPFFNALRLDTSLHVIAIHSRLERQRIMEEADTEDKIKRMKKWFGCICTKYVLKTLIRSLSMCLKNSPVLSCLEVDGLLITGDYLTSILKGCQQNRTLKLISFKNCPIGDEGCLEVCESLHSLPNIEVVNMTSCGLSIKSAESIAKLIKYQQINRYCESWHSSLRYEEPEVNNMAGLRRITLNNNPKIGDEGLEMILNELIDDLWIKAMDMQRCCITEAMTAKIIETIEYNRSLEIADFRHNSLESETISRILECLKSKQPEDSDYQWCSTTTTLDSLLDTSRFTTRPLTTKSSKNISNKTALKRQTTMPFLPKKLTTKDFFKDSNKEPSEAESLKKAKDQLMKLYEKLKEETSKRQQAEEKCLELQKQVDELMSLKKNQLILKEFTNMKTYMNKFVNFIKQHGGSEDHTLIIKDLQKALDEVQVLSKPYESQEVPVDNVQSLFQSLTGKPVEEDQMDLHLDLDSSVNQSSSSFIDVSDTARSSDSESETIRRLLEELTQEDEQKNSSSDLSELSNGSYPDVPRRDVQKVIVKIPAK